MISLFTQNLCSWGSGENTIAERTSRFNKLVDMYAPDIIGVQEATPEWREYLYANMPGFGHIGLPRQEGPKGESCDIFWRENAYTLLSGGTRWLTDTPNVISKLEASSHYRVFTWAVLKQNNSGEQIEELEKEFSILFDETSECDCPVETADRFLAITQELAELKKQRKVMERQLAQERKSYDQVKVAQELMMEMNPSIMEWNEVSIRQLVHTVKVMSAELIEVYLNDGKVIRQSVENKVRKRRP